MAKYSRYNDKQRSLFDFDDEAELVVNLPPKKAETVPEEGSLQTITSSSSVAAHPALRFISFGSGSSGNCSYIGTSEGGVLIDAGIDPEKVFATLKQYGITSDDIKGICVTHDHGDHVRYLYKTIRKHKHIHVYCTNRALNGMLRRHNISRNIKERHVAIFKEIPFTIAGLKITAFEVPHDGTDNAGFFIEYADRKFAVATDIGHINDRARFYLSQAQYLMLESNYDLDMLRNGAYPEYLKNRIIAENGHLDNKDAASLVAELYRPELKYVFLCHLSKDNNTPEKARRAMCEALKNIGIEAGYGEETLQDKACPIQIVTLPRFDASRCYTLRD